MTLEEAINQKNNLLKKLDYEVARLPEPFKTIHLIEVLDFEIANGGLQQWLTNDSGAFVHETISALRDVGATAVSELIASVVRCFPDENIPQEGSLRAQLVDSLYLKHSESWRQLGDQVLAWPDDIDSLLRRYVASKL
jgi:hypothetical protein